MIEVSRKNITADNLAEYLWERLSDYYPAGIPPFAEERLSAELAYMEKTRSEDDFLLCHELNQAAIRSGHILQLDGISVGSMLVFLLTQSRINPLPAHYYCPACGQFELADDAVFGLDLPEKNCPAYRCMKTLRKDGFGIPVESIWRDDGQKPVSLDYYCSEGFFPFGYQVIKNFYAKRNRKVIPKGSITDGNTRLLNPVGAYILPEGKEPADYPQFAAYLSDGTPCFAGNYYEIERCDLKKVILATNHIADSIQKVQAKSGSFCANISTYDFGSLTSRDLTNTGLTSEEECISLQSPISSFYDMACALILPNNSYVDSADRLSALDILKSQTFEACPIYCGEDVFDRMIKDGCDREKAARAMASIRMGRAMRNPAILQQLDVPRDIAAIAVHCRYLFPRGSGAQRLVSLLLLAKYMRDDPVGYFRAIHSAQEK